MGTFLMIAGMLLASDHRWVAVTAIVCGAAIYIWG